MDKRKSLKARKSPKRSGRSYSKPEKLRGNVKIEEKMKTYEKTLSRLKDGGSPRHHGNPDKRQVNVTLTFSSWILWQRLKAALDLTNTNLFNLILDQFKEGCPGLMGKYKKDFPKEILFWYSMSLDPAEYSDLRRQRR